MANKIEIVNVIEIINGIASIPKSFIIQNEVNRTQIVEIAEKLFLECAKENGMDDEEKEESLDNGSYDNQSGYEVLLNWSEVMN